MWLRCGELGADLVSTKSWDAAKLSDQVAAIRKLTNLRQPERFLPKLKELCAEAGVAVVARRAPAGCPASGASRMVAPNKAMILLSFRGLTDDRFWFTVFHEIGHLILHGAMTFVDLDMDDLDESEREANEFASRCIIPDDRLDEFLSLKPAMQSVVRYSVKVGVSPGLIVGQMQHRNMIEPQQLNFLKRHWKWEQLVNVLDYPARGEEVHDYRTRCLAPGFCRTGVGEFHRPNAFNHSFARQSRSRWSGVFATTWPLLPKARA